MIMFLSLIFFTGIDLKLILFKKIVVFGFKIIYLQNKYYKIYCRMYANVYT